MRKLIAIGLILLPALAYAECTRWNRPDGINNPCNMFENPVYSCVCDKDGCYWNVVCYPSK